MGRSKPGTALSFIATTACMILFAGACSTTNPNLKADAVPTDERGDGGGHGGCFLCHRSFEPKTAGPDGFAPGVEPSSICLDCHRYEQGHHPVNVVPKASSLVVNAARSDLPLFDGQIRCLTCHEAHAADNGARPGSDLLRRGDSRDKRELCFACHVQDRYTEINPHRMLDEAGRIVTINGNPVCTLCHDAVPDVLDHTSEVKFRAGVDFLCWRCHSPMARGFVEQHSHAAPSRETRIQMEETHANENVLLPLAENGSLTCSTCHNPHQQGVLLEGPANTGTDDPRRLRIARSELCFGCHGT